MSSSEWDDFRAEQAAERANLNRLLAALKPLLTRCRNRQPDVIELNAMAAMLHSFYNGIEVIFKRVALDLDGRTLGHRDWHRDLIHAMTVPGPKRPVLLSPELYDSLLEYLRFRHVFRNAYFFDLDWEKLSPLVMRLEKTLQDVETALDAFLKAGATPNTGHID